MELSLVEVKHGIVVIFHDDLKCRVLKLERTDDYWLISTDHDSLLIMVELPSTKMLNQACNFFAIGNVSPENIAEILRKAFDIEFDELMNDDDDLPW